MRGKSEAFAGLDAFIAERGDALLATAILLAGGRDAGQDLLQAAIERLMRRWHKIDGDPEGYARRILYHLAVDTWRRRARRPELLTSIDARTTPDETEMLDLRDALIRALSQLPPKQRAVLVLRYWEHLTEAEAAERLGCSVGTVKSSTSRGLARLRDLTSGWTTDKEKNGAPA
ncbi:SigE family RNA polymerase sigma factor [Cryptosporangium sp. NPDC051539]|uniref:SigE family RNA polymerase sigma factor n=1 Tax=Cryptosporangium sp. NPDC051539 TaxID=3363962 RepID=UPI0037B552EA